MKSNKSNEVLESKPAIWVIIGLVIALIGLLSLPEDLNNLVLWFREKSGLDFRWWNTLTILTGTAIMIYGVILLRRRTRAETVLESSKESTNRDYSIFLIPIVYPIIWYKKFEKWGTSGKADDPVSMARFIIFLAGVLIVFIVGGSMLIFGIWWLLGQVMFYLRYGEFMDLIKWL